jgi:hypothetical protein
MPQSDNLTSIFNAASDIRSFAVNDGKNMYVTVRLVSDRPDNFNTIIDPNGLQTKHLKNVVIDYNHNRTSTGAELMSVDTVEEDGRTWLKGVIKVKSSDKLRTRDGDLGSLMEAINTNRIIGVSVQFDNKAYPEFEDYNKYLKRTMYKKWDLINISFCDQPVGQNTGSAIEDINIRTMKNTNQELITKRCFCEEYMVKALYYTNPEINDLVRVDEATESSVKVTNLLDNTTHQYTNTDPEWEIYEVANLANLSRLIADDVAEETIKDTTVRLLLSNMRACSVCEANRVKMAAKMDELNPKKRTEDGANLTPEAPVDAPEAGDNTDLPLADKPPVEDKAVDNTADVEALKTEIADLKTSIAELTADLTAKAQEQTRLLNEAITKLDTEKSNLRTLEGEATTNLNSIADEIKVELETVRLLSKAPQKEEKTKYVNPLNNLSVPNAQFK